MRRPGDTPAQLEIDGEMFSFTSEELDRLVDALIDADSADARALSEEIAALHIAGGVIRLRPTIGERTTLESALTAAGSQGRQHAAAQHTVSSPASSA